MVHTVLHSSVAPPPPKYVNISGGWYSTQSSNLDKENDAHFLRIQGATPGIFFVLWLIIGIEKYVLKRLSDHTIGKLYHFY